MDNFQLTPRKIASLKVRHRTERDRKKADRLKAIISRGSGKSVSLVAEILLLDEKTIRLWLESSKRGGTCGVVKRKVEEIHKRQTIPNL